MVQLYTKKFNGGTILINILDFSKNYQFLLIFLLKLNIILKKSSIISKKLLLLAP